MKFVSRAMIGECPVLLSSPTVVPRVLNVRTPLKLFGWL